MYNGKLKIHSSSLRSQVHTCAVQSEAPVYTEERCVRQLRLVGSAAATLCFEFIAQVAHIATPKIKRQRCCQFSVHAALPPLARTIQKVPDQDLQDTGCVLMYCKHTARIGADPSAAALPHLLCCVLARGIFEVQTAMLRARLHMVGEPLP